MDLKSFAFEDITYTAIGGILVGACFASCAGVAAGPSIAIFAVSAVAATAFAHLANYLLNKQNSFRSTSKIEICSIALMATAIIIAGISTGIIGPIGIGVVATLAICSVLSRLERHINNGPRDPYIGL